MRSNRPDPQGDAFKERIRVPGPLPEDETEGGPDRAGLHGRENADPQRNQHRRGHARP